MLSRKDWSFNCPMKHFSPYSNTSPQMNWSSLLGSYGLPESLFVSIFVVISVCKWFRQICYDEEFWRTVDLTSKTYSNRQLMKFFRRFPRTCTDTLKISGICTSRRAQSNLAKLPPFTEQLGAIIRVSYPNLRYLHVSRYDFCNDSTAVKNISYLPPNLQGLYLRQCEMLMATTSDTDAFLRLPTVPLSNATENFSLQQLEVLSFENSSCLGRTSLDYLPDLCPKLTELNLNGCYKISANQGLTNTLLTYRRTLRRLYLSETKVNEDTMHSLCRELKRLNVLDIRSCKHITRNIVENLLTLKQLTRLLADERIRTLYVQRKTEPTEVWCVWYFICCPNLNKKPFRRPLTCFVSRSSSPVWCVRSSFT